MKDSRLKIIAIILFIVLILMPVVGNLLRYAISDIQIMNTCTPLTEKYYAKDCEGEVSQYIVMHFVFKIVLTIPFIIASSNYFSKANELYKNKKYRLSREKMKISILISAIGSVLIYLL